MEILRYVQELLYKNDCIILPGLGAFVTKYQDAKIDESNNTVLPPKKSISFDSKLVNNDKLLVEYVASRKNISYPDAHREVSKYIAGIKKRIEKSEKVVLDNIGILYLSENKTIVLEQKFALNYLAESSGLTTISAEPVVCETKKAIVITDELPDSKEDEDDNGFIKWIVIAAAVIVVFAIVVVKFDVLKSLNFNSTTAVNDTTQIKDATKTQDTLVLDTTKKVVSPVDTSNNANDTQPIDTIKQEIDEPVEVAPEKTKPEEGKFCIVVGSFPKKEGADRHVADLKKTGLETTIISESGRYRVIAGAFAKREDAMKLKKKLNKNFKKIKPWLHIRK